MNVEFHYYVVYYLARRTGLDDDQSWRIAYSSQHVDASTVSYLVETERGDYRTTVTQDYGWWDESFPRTVYVPFHFFPGDPGHPGARRADGAVNPLNTTPGSRRVRSLLVAALETRDPYRVGIALHTYADSWAHQNWSGALEEWNVLDRDSPIPSIGHAQALTNPDRMGLAWEDSRLAAEHRAVRNWERQRAAARMVYKFLATYNRRDYSDVDFVVDELFEMLAPEKPSRSGQERILDLIIAHDLRRYERREWLQAAVRASPSLFASTEEEQSGYDKLLWLRDAALFRTSILRKKAVPAREGFFESHLYRWNEAAKAHRDAAWRLLPRDIEARVASSGRLR